MKRTLSAMALAATTALSPIAASAETLMFGTGNVVIHPINQRIMTPWAEKLNADGGDALTVRIRHGQMLVNSRNYVDRITDDVVQIAWGMLVFNPGRFPKSLVSTVPFIEGSAEAGALAFCNLYEAGAFGDELDEFVPLFFLPFPQSSIHLNGSPITKMDDLAGKKIMVGSPITANIVSAYGGTPLSINLPDHYQSLQRGTADGNFMTFTAFPAFKLDEVTSDHMTVPLGGATGMVFMTRERYDALSDEARAAIDANSGCEVSREMGAKVDKWEADSLEYVKAQEGHTIGAISDEDAAALKDALSEQVFAGYTSRVDGGEAILEQWIAAMAEAVEATSGN